MQQDFPENGEYKKKKTRSILRREKQEAYSHGDFVCL